MACSDEKKFSLGDYSSKVAENTLLHKNLTPFDLVLIQCKRMHISAKNVHLDIEKLNIDRNKFESFHDAKLFYEVKKKLLEKNIKDNLDAAEPVCATKMAKTPLSTRESHCIKIRINRKNVHDDRE